MNGLKLAISRPVGLAPVGRIVSAAGAMLLFAGLAGWLVALTGVQLTGPAMAAGLVGALVAVVGGCLVAGREHTELRAYLGAAAVVAIAFVGMGLAGGGVLEGGWAKIDAGGIPGAHGHIALGQREQPACVVLMAMGEKHAV